MRVILLDTNIVSILFNEDNPMGPKCEAEIGDAQCYTSFMTRGELLPWPNVNRWGEERRQRLLVHIARYTVLLPDEETCAIWADTIAESRRCGRPMATSDAWIAATAKQWKLPLVTTNHRDFEHLSGLTPIPI